MSPQAWTAVATIAAVFFSLAFTRLAPDLILVAGLVLLMVLGVMTPADALSGFSNPGIVTVGVLFIVAAGIRDTGAISFIIDRVLRRPRTLAAGQARVMIPTAAFSAFLNNTPIVAVMVPALLDWGRKLGFSASRLLIPLSYAAILGGTCTLIGTSTNLVVDGLVRGSSIEGYPRIGFFDITRVALPAALVGMGFILLTGRWLLPDRKPAVAEVTNAREYALEMIVENDSPLIGKSIEEAGLRHLPGLFLIEIERRGQILAAVSPRELLQSADRLVFVGVIDSVVDLQRIRGLKPATDQVFKLDTPASNRILIEAVVSNSSPIVRRNIRESRFRNRYNAVVIAVARDGERLPGKIGDIVVQPGDTLLLEAAPGFLELHRNSRDFYLVSPIEGYTPPRYERAGMSLTILALMVGAAAIFHVDMILAAFVAAGAMVATKCLTGDSARRSIDWRLLVAIAAALGLGRALGDSGAAAVIAEGIVGFAGDRPFLSLVLIYLVTALFTELVTNNAAAALIFPIALATSFQVGIDPRPFIYAIMVAASASFVTPIGYQTNLMVYGPGGYRFTDFARIGIPTATVVMITTCTMLWWYYF